MLAEKWIDIVSVSFTRFGLVSHQCVVENNSHFTRDVKCVAELYFSCYVFCSPSPPECLPQGGDRPPQLVQYRLFRGVNSGPFTSPARVIFRNVYLYIGMNCNCEGFIKDIMLSASLALCKGNHRWLVTGGFPSQRGSKQHYIFNSREERMSGTYVKVTGSVYVPDVAYICWISVKSTGVDVHVQLASVPEVKTRSKLFAVPTVETGAAGVKLKRLIKWHDDVIK